ncbi:hypothetical protein EDD11_006734 [Mortierella claussenii]|nr:hypothetical protein EDD11_006734 [Mortierella claussenii]
MAYDDLLVRNAIQRMGVNASVEWTRQCIAYKHKVHGSSSAAAAAVTATTAAAGSLQDLAQFIFEMYLLADFRTLEPKPILPSSIAIPHEQQLFTDLDSHSGGRLQRTSGGVILQIIEIQDIGISSLKMLEACETIGTAGEAPGGFQVGRTLPRGGMIALGVTDGLRKMKAVLMEPIAGIAMEMKLGAKIRLKDVEVRHGVLQLHPGTVFLLGGEVASMNQYPRRLVIMNQMKKRLGLPLDPMPAVKDVPSTSPNSPVSVAASAAVSNSQIPSNATVNMWRNPQASVDVQDVVASRQLPSQTTYRPLGGAIDGTSNPWASFNSSRVSSPPAPPPKTLYNRDTKEDSSQFKGRVFSQEWDTDMGLDDMAMALQDADWEVMSQSSVNERHQLQNENGAESRGGSPPLMATQSPVKRGLLGRRSLTLRSPHSSHQQQEERKGRDSWEVEKSPFNDRKTKRIRTTDESDGSATEKDSKGLDGDSFNTRREALAVSNGADVEGGKATDRRARRMSRDGSRSTSPFIVDAEAAISKCNQTLSPSVPPPYSFRDDSMAVEETESLWHKSEQQGKKRGASMEEESSDHDYTTSRRRSRSFLPSPRIEDDILGKVKLEKDDDGLLRNVKLERALFNSITSTSRFAVEKTVEDGGSGFQDDLPMPRIISSLENADETVSKIKVERQEVSKRTSDPPHTTVIDLSSDDDEAERGCNSSTSAMPTQSDADHDVPDLDFQKRIKLEPRDHRDFQSIKMDHPMAPVKQEETLLEFDMDDDEDFGGLSELTHVVPEVELDQVEAKVRSGQEVRAKARVHKLGKFSLTTLAVSIPITLLPVKTMDESMYGTQADIADRKLEGILDQPVVELMLEYSIAEFRNLVRINEPEAKNAVSKLRMGLSEVESVECLFKGVRGNIPVIRELKVLSKKRR